ncbi:MAG: radical SAM protein [Firmicutes bacterium]|nr:radical SAM protein [Bacillota bacterium]
MIKMSAGTAHVLGLKKLAIDALPTTAYLMSGEKCTHDCGFCPQARNASSGANLLSRVTWSERDVDEIVVGVGAAFRKGQMKRACLQVVDGCGILAQVKDTVKKIKEHSDIPVCVSAKVKTLEEVLTLARTGVDRIGLALDAASERVFKATKTG